MSLGGSYTTATPSRARELLERALAIGQKSFDKNGGEIGEIYLCLGTLSYYEAKLAEAERWHRQALEAFEKAGGPEVEARRDDALRHVGYVAGARSHFGSARRVRARPVHPGRKEDTRAFAPSHRFQHRMHRIDVPRRAPLCTSRFHAASRAGLLREVETGQHV